MVQTTGTKPELQVEPEHVNELLKSHDMAFTDEELLLIDEQRKLFLEMKSATEEDAVNTAEMRTKDLQYYVDLVDKAAEGFEKIDTNFERSSTMGKMLSNSVECYREITNERKSRQTLFLPYLTELPQSRNRSAVTAWNIEQPSTLKQEPMSAKVLRVTEGSDDH
ncbi:hypothetical protein M514_26275 [Trichuris suis]|uniref:Uncharacterized protein n=1 Tax=Trichuris suis TaxID=68888 RepID=A0A085MWJ1_9BILA|nr:hypothetical protein M514_26275 [Trichuris suis]